MNRRLTKDEIIAELPQLTHRERREIVKQILEIEQVAELLDDCERLANERFLMLDDTEAEDGQSPASWDFDCRS